MFASPTAKKVRAIAVAIAVTFVTNYAISFASKADGPVGKQGPENSVATEYSSRGSVPTVKPSPRPERGSVPTVKPSPRPE
jgi:hypothetical protein